jgi:hypothetical protein
MDFRFTVALYRYERSQSVSETELCTRVGATYGCNAGTKVAIHDATD